MRTDDGPSPQALADLYALQEVDSAILQRSKRLRALDAGLAEKQAFEEAKRAYAQSGEALTAAQTELRDAELELQSVETKINEQTRLLYSGKVQNPRELDALQHEIEALQRRRGALDERVLALMERVEVCTAEQASRKAELDKSCEAYRVKAEAYIRAARKLREELAGLEAKRQEQLRSIPAALLKRYEAIRSTKDGIGIARLDGPRCGACQTILPRNTLLAAQEGRQLVTCESCGRLLVNLS